MVEYYYDAWGNHKWTGDETLAKRNPFRYRGYYYDEETGLYFLKSRYYDPKIGRFINIDSVCYIAPELLNGLNLYAYCLNNPVMYVDPYGTFFISIGATIALSTLGVLGIGAAVEIVFHPIEKTINNISNWVGDLYYDFEFNRSTNANINLSSPNDTSLIISLIALEYYGEKLMSREKNRGRDTEFRNKTNDELEEELAKAKRENDSAKIQRILKEMKMRGMRNMRKQRGGPHMRGILLLLLGGYLLDNYDY